MRRALVPHERNAPPLGPLQVKLLQALRRYGCETSLESLAAYAAGLIPALGTRPPIVPGPRRATYVAVARAIATLRRRGLVHTEVIGTANGRLEWPRNVAGAVCPCGDSTIPITPDGEADY
jgi:hypothetical protein